MALHSESDVTGLVAREPGMQDVVFVPKRVETHNGNDNGSLNGLEECAHPVRNLMHFCLQVTNQEKEIRF